MVYKLVEINGVPKIKMSEEIEKTTLPGNKQVIRVFEDAHSSMPSFDVICLESEKLEAIEHLKVWEPFTEISRNVKLENV
jgi:nicotinate phosphoribosyltransferase